MSGDYLVKISGQDVFQLGHEEAKDLIRKAGNKLSMVVERGEKIVPSMNSAFPKPKKEEVEPSTKSYSQMVRYFAAFFAQNFILNFSSENKADGANVVFGNIRLSSGL